MTRPTRWSGLLAVSFTAIACGGGPPPNDQVAATQGAIRAAEEAGADQNPRASLYLKLAKEEIDKARVLIDNGDNDRAKRMLGRAEADAELARSVARGKKLEDEAQEALEQVDKLKQSIK
jgi:hypothetical protein